MKRIFTLLLKAIIPISLVFSFPIIHANTNTLTLAEAEQIAISSEPDLQRLQAETEALDQQAIAEGQLPDPQLMVGVINLPTNTFSFNQDDMTMKEVGIEQAFPRGLGFKTKQTQSMAQAERFEKNNQKLILLRNVRQTWLELYYWNQALKITQKNHKLLQDLLKATKSRYAAAKLNLQDVIQMKLELSRLEDQTVQIQTTIASLQAQLTRWVGEAAMQPLPTKLPTWPTPNSSALQANLLTHPLLQQDIALIQAKREDVAYAKAQTKPSFDVGVSYGFRQGNMEDGQPRSDMITGQVTMDLPVFPNKRQDKRIDAAVHQLEAAQLSQTAHYKDLTSELKMQYVTWQRLNQRTVIFNQEILPESKQNSKAALLALGNSTADLTTVLRAYINNLNAQLEQTRIQVDREKARVALLYLEGK